MFSFYTNGKDLFACEMAADTTTSRMNCLDGIRAISTIWIVLLHIGLAIRFVPASNTFEMQTVTHLEAFKETKFII